jgi:RNA polymerase sigma-70 factor, ECF subfamily
MILSPFFSASVEAFVFSTFLMIATDSHLSLARDGDREAFGLLYDAYSRPVYDFLFFRTFDEARAQDLMSETFFKALRSLSSFKGVTLAEFKSWIFTIAYNSFIDSTRTPSDYADIDDHVDVGQITPDHASTIDGSDRLERVLAYLDTLWPPHKDIILMAVWDDLKYSEIAIITGLSLSNIKKIVSRTLPKIAANVANFLPFIFLFN